VVIEVQHVTDEGAFSHKGLTKGLYTVILYLELGVEIILYRAPWAHSHGGKKSSPWPWPPKRAVSVLTL
jgi:hypothetical protein